MGGSKNNAPQSEQAQQNNRAILLHLETLLHSPIRLIVGLANPGKEYAETRHNAGAWFIQEIADYAKVNLRAEVKYHGLHGLAHLDDQSAHLLIPRTFMNHSGQAVQACMHYLKLAPNSILIVHD